jgi:hypothetical protein
MADVSRDQSFDEILRKVGATATATFDHSASNPTKHASSEATNAAPVDGDDEDLEEEDDDAAALEEDDEENEDVDVEDEADAQD